MKRCWALMLGFLLSGCSDNEGATAGGNAGAVMPKARAATLALYGDPQTGALTPFPSNRYTVADSSSRTGLRTRVASIATDAVMVAFPTFADQLSGADGFSTVGGVAVSFGGDLDPAILSPGTGDFTGAMAPLVLLDVDDHSPERGQAIPLVVSYYPTPTTDDGPRVDFTLVAQPARPLRPRTSYLFAVTSRLKDARGAAVGPTEATDALLAGGEGAYGAQVRAALPLLRTAAGVVSDQIALVTLFTTASVIDETFAMAQQRRAAPSPHLVGDLAVVATAPEPDRRIRFKGRFNAPEFRQIMGNGQFQIKDGAPVAQAEVDLEFLLSLSDREAVGPRPIVIFAHGLGSDKEEVWDTSLRLADLGAAVIGIDAPYHGSRGEPGTDPHASALFNFFALDQDNGSFDLLRIRDNFRQMASDQLELVRLIKTLSTLDLLPAGAPDGIPDLDTSRILYLSESFGSVLGSTVLAEAPEIQAACLTVGGAGLTTVLRESHAFHLLINGLFPASLTDGDKARFFSSAQAILDPGDPLNFAPYVSRQAGPGVDHWAPRHLLLQEVYHDLLVPNLSSELLARTLGLSQLTPLVYPISGLLPLPAPISGNQTGGGTAVLSQFDRMNGGQTADHNGLISSPEARSQYLRFFQDVVAGKPPVVLDPYSP
jgi:hypothetical protein